MSIFLMILGIIAAGQLLLLLAMTAMGVDINDTVDR